MGTQLTEGASTKLSRGSSSGWRKASDQCRRWLRRVSREKIETGASDLLSLPKNLDQFTSQLAEQCRQLTPLAGEIERRFLAIGNSLEQLPAASENLVRQSERLLRLASGREDGDTILQSTQQGLQGPLGFIDRYGEATRGLLSKLRESLARIESILHHEASLNRTVAPLKFIRTLFKVESSGLDHQLQSMFIALTEDISKLQQQVSETFGEKFQILRETRQAISTVLTGLETQGRKRDETVAAKRRDLDQALASLKNDLERNQQKDIQLTRISAAINQAVGQLVFSLQAQDIISQKAAHVLSSLERIQAEAKRYHDTPDKLSAARVLKGVTQAARIELAQVLAIKGDLEKTETELAAAVEVVNSQIGQLDNDCLSLKEFDQVTAAVDGLVHVLFDTISEVRELVSTTVASAGAAYDAIRPIGGRTSNVTSTMRQLSSHIRLIALNAQVQAARIENGTGLEVLAAATAGVAVDAGQISEEVAGHLDRFCSELDALVEAFAALRDEGTSHQPAWNEQASADEKTLHAHRDATLAELERIANSTDQIRTLAGRMRGELDIKSVAEAKLDNVSVTLELLIEFGRRELSAPEFASVMAEQSDDLIRTNTMESERLISERILSTGQPTGQEPELFGDDSAKGGESVPTTNRDLTGLASSTTLESGAEPEAKKEFGDNVDLF